MSGSMLQVNTFNQYHNKSSSFLNPDVLNEASQSQNVVICLYSQSRNLNVGQINNLNISFNHRTNQETLSTAKLSS